MIGESLENVSATVQPPGSKGPSLPGDLRYTGACGRSESALLPVPRNVLLCLKNCYKYIVLFLVAVGLENSLPPKGGLAEQLNNVFVFFKLYFNF